MITLPGYDRTRWAVTAKVTICWDWTLTGLHWDIEPGIRRIYGTILPPFLLTITETLISESNQQDARANH